jgi:hypothetical protein
MSKLWAWFVQHNISTHTIAAIAAALAMAYAGYAPFHVLVLKYFGLLPSDLQTLVLTSFFIGALYKSGVLKFTVKEKQKIVVETTNPPSTQTTTLETTKTVTPAPTDAAKK